MSSPENPAERQGDQQTTDGPPQKRNRKDTGRFDRRRGSIDLGAAGGKSGKGGKGGQGAKAGQRGGKQCERCGRWGHLERACTASFHASGEKIQTGLPPPCVPPPFHERIWAHQPHARQAAAHERLYVLNYNILAQSLLDANARQLYGKAVSLGFAHWRYP